MMPGRNISQGVMGSRVKLGVRGEIKGESLTVRDHSAIQ